MQRDLLLGRNGSPLIGQRTPPTMGVSPSLHVPPNNVDFQNLAEDSTRKASVYSHHSLVASVDMVPPSAIAGRQPLLVSPDRIRLFA